MSTKEKAEAARRRFAERTLEQLERDYRKGDKETILVAIGFSLLGDVKIPRWAKDAFLNAVTSPPRSWDDVFGRPSRKGERIDANRKRKKNEPRLFFGVRRLLASGVGVKAALRQVGEDLNISYESARAMWYDPKARQNYAMHRNSDYVVQKMRNDLGPKPDLEATAAWFKENEVFVREMEIPADELFSK